MSDPDMWQSDLDPAWRKLRSSAIGVVVVVAAIVIVGLWWAISRLAHG